MLCRSRARFASLLGLVTLSLVACGKVAHDGDAEPGSTDLGGKGGDVGRVRG